MFNSAGILSIKRLVEAFRSAEHSFHAGNRRGIPAADRVIEIFSILKHAFHIRSIPGFDSGKNTAYGITEQFFHGGNLIGINLPRLTSGSDTSVFSSSSVAGLYFVVIRIIITAICGSFIII